MNVYFTYFRAATVSARTMTSVGRGELGHDDPDESSSSEAVTSSPQVLSHRDWVQVSASNQQQLTAGDGVAVSSRGTGRRFRLLTYNILSDLAISDSAGEYLYCPTELRYMSSRHDRIINEIQAMQPNIVCLQVSSSTHLFLSTSLCLCLCMCL